MNGFLIIDKEKDWTSNDVVVKLRGILKTKKIGHTGTLDPLATGVLVCAVNQATKLIEFLQKSEKEYIATFIIGKTSDTYDSTGKIEDVSDRKPLKKEIEKVLKKYTGEIDQKPPLFSAIKIQGKKAYEIARSGEYIELPKRRIYIKKIEILTYKYPELKIRIICGSGTYIRSLGHDIGQDLKTGILMSDLRRVKAGKFSLKDAITIGKVSLKTPILWSKDLIDLPSVEISEKNIDDLKNGKFIAPTEEISEDIFLGVQKNLPVVILEKRGKLWKTKKLLI